jgi:hypothetical protein
MAGIQLAPFRGSSVVEQSTVNRSVVGSNPTRGANISLIGTRRDWPKALARSAVTMTLIAVDQARAQNTPAPKRKGELNI